MGGSALRGARDDRTGHRRPTAERCERERPGGLRLWTFASNTSAQRFYERHGFVAIDRTDGQHNEERAPDILYTWRAPRPPADDTYTIRRRDPPDCCVG
jgi:ribosomal protein S18 acetylase RimI-like enzyme